MSNPVDWYLSLGHFLPKHSYKNDVQIKNQSSTDNSLRSPA